MEIIISGSLNKSVSFDLTMFLLFFSAGCQWVWCHCAQVWSHPSADYGCGQFPSLYQQSKLSMMIMIDVNQIKCFASFACLEKWLWMTLGRPTKWNWINVYFMMIIDRLWWWCWWLSVITAHMSLQSKVKTFCFSGREESAFDNKPLAQPGEFWRQTASPQ